MRETQVPSVVRDLKLKLQKLGSANDVLREQADALKASVAEIKTDHVGVVASLNRRCQELEDENSKLSRNSKYAKLVSSRAQESDSDDDGEPAPPPESRRFHAPGAAETAANAKKRRCRLAGVLSQRLPSVVPVITPEKTKRKRAGAEQPSRSDQSFMRKGGANGRGQGVDEKPSFIGDHCDKLLEDLGRGVHSRLLQLVCPPETRDLTNRYWRSLCMLVEELVDTKTQNTAEAREKKSEDLKVLCENYVTLYNEAVGVPEAKNYPNYLHYIKCHLWLQPLSHGTNLSQYSTQGLEHLNKIGKGKFPHFTSMTYMRVLTPYLFLQLLQSWATTPSAAQRGEGEGKGAGGVLTVRSLHGVWSSAWERKRFSWQRKTRLVNLRHWGLRKENT